MALPALGSLASALITRPGTQTSDHAKDHGLVAQPVSPARLLPRDAGAQPAGTTEPSIAAVRLATRQVEQAVRAQAGSLAFNITEAAGKTMVTVTDSDTGTVLRQIPADEILSLSQAMNNMQGLLLSQRA